MMDFENNHLSIIEQYESSASEVERAFFTGRYKLSKKTLCFAFSSINIDIVFLLGGVHSKLISDVY